MLEAYENGNYFQMVMEKHGDGLDLFEFIERRPKLTEQLVSYMFRQVLYNSQECTESVCKMPNCSVIFFFTSTVSV